MLHLKECPLDASTCYFVLRYYIDIYIVSLQQCFCYSQSLQGFPKKYPFENFYSPLSLSTGISEPLLQRDSITDELLGIWRVFKLLYFGKALVGSFSFGQQSVVINRFIN